MRIIHTSNVQGFIDVEKEKTRLKALQAQKAEQLSRVQQDINRPDFKTKVPEDVQRAQIEKVLSLKGNDLCYKLVTERRSRGRTRAHQQRLLRTLRVMILCGRTQYVV